MGEPEATPGTQGADATSGLPDWARELITLYESNAYTQFILSGNVHDRIVLPVGPRPEVRSLVEFLLRVLLPGFDVILSYDLGNGIRVRRGESRFKEWRFVREHGDLPRTPRPAIEVLSHYFRHCARLSEQQGQRTQVACVVADANLVAPNVPGGINYDLGALALMMRDWSTDEPFWKFPFASFLITENQSDLHALLQNNPRAAHIEVPLPGEAQMAEALGIFGRRYPEALGAYPDPRVPAASLAGATLAAVEGLLKTREFQREPLGDGDLVTLKKELVERDCNGLIEFVEPDRSLADFHGQPGVVDWFRKDLALWSQGELQAMPMGYLLCGPVGTGKTYLAECLAGEAAVPVVKLKNFRDKWVGSTEANLERIFRLLHALGRCFVFVDEADQALGRRAGSGGDAGVSGRVYSMMADEMSDTRNRGRIVWILASSRPDLIEVDLKRPGRVDVKIPLFPASTAREGFELIRALCRKRGIEVGEAAYEALADQIPQRVTPGSAEALAVKVYRTVRIEGAAPEQALADCLADYRHPVSPEVIEFQMRLAIREASDRDFIPAAFRHLEEE